MTEATQHACAREPKLIKQQGETNKSTNRIRDVCAPFFKITSIQKISDNIVDLNDAINQHEHYLVIVEFTIVASETHRDLSIRPYSAP